MRLAIVTYSIAPGDGQGRVNYEVAREALRRGHHVAGLAVEIAPELAADPRFRAVRTPVRRCPTYLARALLLAARSSAWLRRHRTSVDAVLANGGNTWAMADVNAAHFVHGAWRRSVLHGATQQPGARGLYHRFSGALNAAWERRAFRQAGTVVAVSELVRDELLGVGVQAERIRVVLNGVDTEEFRPCRGVLRPEGIRSDAPLALFAGGLGDPRKNLDTVLAALARVEGLHLAVAGGGREKDAYRRQAQTLGVVDRVHLLGHRRDLPRLMQAADLFVFPSRYETFGNVVLEAMASGLPVIAARSVGAAALLDPESGVVLDRPDDIDGLAAAITSLIHDPARRRSMGAAARAIAERHRWADTAAAYVNLLEQATSRRGAGC